MGDNDKWLTFILYFFPRNGKVILTQSSSSFLSLPCQRMSPVTNKRYLTGSLSSVASLSLFLAFLVCRIGAFAGPSSAPGSVSSSSSASTASALARFLALLAFLAVLSEDSSSV